MMLENEVIYKLVKVLGAEWGYDKLQSSYDSKQ